MTLQSLISLLLSVILLVTLVNANTPSDEHSTNSTSVIERHYTLNLTWTWANPDGFYRSCIAINNRVVGPTLFAVEGETLVITVNNQLMTQVASIHWHGLLVDPQWDGASMITQYPISPGQSFEYRIKLHQSGTYYYHSHTPLQYSDGLYGALVIAPQHDPIKDTYHYDEERVIVLSEWFHAEGNTLAVTALHVPNDVWKLNSPKSVLFNGRGRSDCQDAVTANHCDPHAPLEVITVKSGYRYRFRIINSATRVALSFSAEQHTMTVVDSQGERVEPIDRVHRLDLSIGDRFDVLIDADQPPNNYHLAAQIIGCTNCMPNSTVNDTPSFGLRGFAILRYDGASESEPNHEYDPRDSDRGVQIQFNDARLIPFSVTPPPAATDTWKLNATKIAPEVLWRINGLQFQTPKVPVLFEIYEGVEFEPSSLIWTLEYGLVLDIIFYSFNNMDHPIHLHGNRFWLLGFGDGPYDAAHATLNTKNPRYVDTAHCPGRGWVAVRVIANRPGPWLFHCHQDFHHVELMGFVLNVAPDHLKDKQLPTGWPVCDSYPPLYHPSSHEPPSDLEELFQGPTAARKLLAFVILIVFALSICAFGFWMNRGH